MTEQSKKDTIWLDKKEYAIVSSEVMKKYTNKSVKKGSVYTADYYYILRNIKDGNFEVIGKIKIEGNEDDLNNIKE